MDERRTIRCDRCGLFFRNADELNRHKFHKHIMKQSPTHSPTRRSNSFSRLRDPSYSSGYSTPSATTRASFDTSMGHRNSFGSTHESHSSSALPRFQCRYCGLAFSLSLLQEHVRTVHGHRTEPIRPRLSQNSLPPTGLPSPNILRLPRAGSSSATQARHFRCDLCGNVFATTEELEVHAMSFHRRDQIQPKSSSRGPRFSCHLCDKSLSTQSNLREHIKSYHRKERRYECPKCGLKFARKSIVANHLQNIHGRQRRYKCTSCDATFDEIGPFSKHYHQCKGSRS